DLTDAALKLLVVRRGRAEELDAPIAHRANGGDDVVRRQGKMLYARPAIELEILVDLRLLFALRRLVDRELDPLIAVRHHLRHERRVLGRDILVVERDEILEAHHALVERDPHVHFSQFDVADTMVDMEQTGGVRLEARLARLKAWHKWTSIVATLDERM